MSYKGAAAQACVWLFYILIRRHASAIHSLPKLNSWEVIANTNISKELIVKGLGFSWFKPRSQELNNNNEDFVLNPWKSVQTLKDNGLYSCFV